MNIFSPNQKIRSSELNQNFADLANGTGDDIANSLVQFRDESLNDYVATGLVVSAGAGLTYNISSGVVIINGIRIPFTAQSGVAIVASKDVYLDINSSGVITPNAVTIGATAPTLATNNLRLAKVVTGASAITSVTQTGGDFLGNPIYCTDPDFLRFKNAIVGHWYRSADGVHAGLTWYVNPMDSLSFQKGGFLSNGNGVRVPYTGSYRVTGKNTFQDGTVNTDCLVGFNINNTTAPTGIWIRQARTYNPHSVQYTTVLNCNAGDIIYMFEYNGTVGNYRINGGAGGDGSSLMIEFIGK